MVSSCTLYHATFFHSYLNQNEIQLVDEKPLFSQCRLIGRKLDDQGDNVGFNALRLFL